MPKRIQVKQNPRAPRSLRRVGGKGVNPVRAITRVPFRLAIGNNAANNSAAININEVSLSIANLGDRIIDAGDIYSLWRLRSLRAYCYGFNSVGTVAATISPGYMEHGIAFTPVNSGDFTAPTTLQHLWDMPKFHVSSEQFMGRMNISTAEFNGSSLTHWYSTATQGSSEFQYAGTFYTFASANFATTSITATVRCIIEGVAEFKEPIDVALIPFDKRVSRLKREINNLNITTNDAFIDVGVDLAKDEKKLVDGKPPDVVKVQRPSVRR
jgi:hypothetical protein